MKKEDTFNTNISTSQKENYDKEISNFIQALQAKENKEGND